MNSFYKNMNAFVIGAMVFSTVPAYSMENEVEAAPIAWYKKSSVQVAAAITTAAAIYSFAVYKGKVSSPAVLLPGLFAAHIAKTVAVEAQEGNNESNSNQEQEVSQPSEETSEKVVIVNGMIIEPRAEITASLKYYANKLKGFGNSFKDATIETLKNWNQPEEN